MTCTYSKFTLPLWLLFLYLQNRDHGIVLHRTNDTTWQNKPSTHTTNKRKQKSASWNMTYYWLSKSESKKNPDLREKQHSSLFSFLTVNLVLAVKSLWLIHLTWIYVSCSVFLILELWSQSFFPIESDIFDHDFDWKGQRKAVTQLWIYIVNI